MRIDIDVIYKIVGQVTYSTTKIEFLLANMAADLGLIKSYPEFNSEYNFSEKIQQITTKAGEMSHDRELTEMMISYSNRLCSLEDKKNRILHSIILTHDDEYVFHNFRKAGKLIRRASQQYNPREVYELNENLIDLHNDLHSFWGKFSSAALTK